MKKIGIVIVAFAVGSVISARAQLPVSGRPVPEMAVFDTIMTNFMAANNITAGVLGMSLNGRIEYLRGFGWLVEPSGGNPGTPLPENALMRTASVVKPITAAAVKDFARAGGFGANGLNSNVFDGLVVGTSGLLSVTPSPSLGDARHANLTLNHLILHQTGFHRTVNPPGEVMFNSRTVAAALGVPSPPANHGVMRYMLGHGLHWPPGTVSNLDVEAAYSNYGYMVLGEVLDAYAPGGYLGYVRSRILNPARWIPSTEFDIARSLPAHRNPREPRYIGNETAQSVFDNNPPIDVVPAPDGGFYIEGMLAHGGVIASAQAMLLFGNAYRLDYAGNNIGEPITATNPMRNDGHSGALDGTSTLLKSRTDNIVVYVAFNRRGNFDFAGKMVADIEEEFKKTTPAYAWPNRTSDGFWVQPGGENLNAGFGGYDSTFQGFQSALNRVTDGSRVRLKTGSQPWAGTIDKQVRLDAPEGAATLGR